MSRLTLKLASITLALFFAGCSVLPSHQTSEPCQGPDDYRGSDVHTAICYNATLQNMSTTQIEKEQKRRTEILKYTQRDADRLYLAMALLANPNASNDTLANEVLNGIKIKDNRRTATTDFAKLLKMMIMDRQNSSPSSSSYRSLRRKHQAATTHESQQAQRISELNEALMKQTEETERLLQQIEALKQIDQTIDSRSLAEPTEIEVPR